MELKQFKPIFSRQPVLFAYLFGSNASGGADRRSDVDIAVYLKPTLSSKTQYKIRLRLLGEVCAALKRDDVDLVLLNQASPLLAFRATARGKIIYSRDELARVRFEARVMSLYYDRQYHLERSARAMFERTAIKGLRQ